MNPIQRILSNKVNREVYGIRCITYAAYLEPVEM